MVGIYNSEKEIKVLYVQAGLGIGGAKVSLLNIIRSRMSGVSPSLVTSLPVDDIFAQLVGDKVDVIDAMYLPALYKRRVKGFRNKLMAFLGGLIRGGYFWPTVKIAIIILKNKIDLVHSNSSTTPVGALAAKLTGRPHIWHIREPLGDGTDFPLAFGEYLTARFIANFSKKVICISDYVAAYFRKYGIYPVIILNGIDLEKFNVKTTQNDLRARYGLNSSIVIGMVGSLGATWKGHACFLEAASLIAAKIPCARFFVFGGSSNLDITPYTQMLRQKTSELGLSEKLFWVEHIQDIPSIMNSMDILIHPALREGSGRVVMEAMASGRPVIAVKSGGVQELIQDGINGFLVAPNSSESLAEKTISLCIDSQLRRSVGRQAREYAEKNFSHERTAYQILEIYRSVLIAK